MVGADDYPPQPPSGCAFRIALNFDYLPPPPGAQLVPLIALPRRDRTLPQAWRQPGYRALFCRAFACRLPTATAKPGYYRASLGTEDEHAPPVDGTHFYPPTIPSNNALTSTALRFVGLTRHCSLPFITPYRRPCSRLNDDAFSSRVG